MTLIRVKELPMSLQVETAFLTILIYTYMLFLAIGQEHQMEKKESHFDSNCITPGTPFMAHLATCLRYHIASKQNTDPLWKKVRLVVWISSFIYELLIS